MASKPTLSQEVRDLIHFDTLFEQGKQVIRDHANQTWDDLAEHDPGITLLQALTYNVSDLAYRHALPLTDLLMHKSDQKEIFSPQFAPEQMLTTSPITEEDYRRALLDLHSLDSLDDKENKSEYEYHDFYFRNVQLKREPKENRYRYWHDLTTREFLFLDPRGELSPSNNDVKGRELSPSKNDVKERELLGGYVLYVELSPGMIQKRAEETLKKFLQTHRNLCEQVRKTEWIKAYDSHAFHVAIELEDDCNDPEKVAAKILTQVQDTISPIAQRLSAKLLSGQQQSNESIYSGPDLKRGLIPVLPPERDYSAELTMTASPLVNKLLEIDGIKRIKTLGFAEKKDLINAPGNDLINAPGNDLINVHWEATIPKNTYPQIWLREAFNNKEDVGNIPQIWLGEAFNNKKDIGNILAKQVTLLKRGQKVATDSEKIRIYIQSMRQSSSGPLDAPSLLGRFRNIKKYHQASQYLPPCYGMQVLKPDSKQKQLRQFLLPFEQQLANDCDQLASLPDLLSFERGGNDHVGTGVRVWGKNLDFLESFLKANEKDNLDIEGLNIKGLIDHLKKDEKDPIDPIIIDKERAIINYLLGYFGADPVTKVLLKVDSDQDYLSVQRGYLAQQGELGYARSCIQINAVSALQRRIAARLGVGKDLFKEGTNLHTLPFYLVEHNAFMPKQPPEDQSDKFNWLNIESINIDKGLTNITIKTKKAREFNEIDCIDIIIGTQFFIGVKIKSIIDDGLVIDFSKHEQFQACVSKYLNKIDELIKGKAANFKKCEGGCVIFSDGNKLIITLGASQKKMGFDVGQLIDLQIDLYTIFRLMIRGVDQEKGQIELHINDSMQLKNVVLSTKDLKGKIVYFHSSIIWLKEKSHDIYLDSKNENSYLIKSDIYPSPFKENDEIIIISKDGVNKRDAIIKSFDKRYFKIEHEGNFKIDEHKDVWYLKKKEIQDLFNFMVSVVFNRKWLETSLDPYATMEWVRKIVLEEIPCHISAKIHWFDDEKFGRFGTTYGNWQNDLAPLGDLSYQLLSDLSLGDLPTPIKGIGMMMIAKNDSEVRKGFINENGTAIPKWDNDKVQNTGLWYVPSETQPKKD